jgi:hypothetical protein
MSKVPSADFKYDFRDFGYTFIYCLLANGALHASDAVQRLKGTYESWPVFAGLSESSDK